jgi:hypothetical protein
MVAGKIMSSPPWSTRTNRADVIPEGWGAGNSEKKDSSVIQLTCSTAAISYSVFRHDPYLASPITT